MGSTPTARSVAAGKTTTASEDRPLPQALVSSDLGEGLAELIAERVTEWDALAAGPADQRPAGVTIPSKLERSLLRSLGVQLADYHAERPAGATDTAGGAS